MSISWGLQISQLHPQNKFKEDRPFQGHSIKWICEKKKSIKVKTWSPLKVPTPSVIKTWNRPKTQIGLLKALHIPQRTEYTPLAESVAWRFQTWLAYCCVFHRKYINLNQVSYCQVQFCCFTLCYFLLSTFWSMNNNDCQFICDRLSLTRSYMKIGGP